MLFGELGPLLRPLSRRLAAAGWCCAAVGLTAGLAVAVGSGVRVSPEMVAVQAAGIIATAAAGILLALAALSQPSAEAAESAEPARSGSGGEEEPIRWGMSHPGAAGLVDASAPDSDEAEWQVTTAAAHVRSFLVAAVAMFMAVVGFAVAGWLLPGGPSPQSMAFSQIFLLGAACCGLTFVLLHKVAPAVRQRIDARPPDA